MSKWGEARVDRFEGVFTGQWGVTFHDIVARFFDCIEAGDTNLLADSMREQYHSHLFMPGLRL